MDSMATSTENPNNSLKVHWRDGGSFTKVSGEKINTETFIIFVNAKKGHLVAQTENTMQYRAVPKTEIFGYTYTLVFNEDNTKVIKYSFVNIKTR